jgi:hypothetical protein
VSVYLQQIRLVTRTKDVSDAGTDDGVELWYFVTKIPNDYQGTLGVRDFWQVWSLDNSGDDRERGQTDVYERSLILTEIAQYGIPQGVVFGDMERVRRVPFYLKIKGPDWWKIDNYSLYGRFKELVSLNLPIVDRGWVLMAQEINDVQLSTDSREASVWHQILINGPLV